MLPKGSAPLAQQISPLCPGAQEPKKRGPAAVHSMDNGGLPLSSPLPLSQPAVQAPNENPDAIIPSETTGVDGITRAYDMVITTTRVLNM